MIRMVVVGAGLMVLAPVVAVSAQVLAGPEFRVNSHTTDKQHYSRLAMEPDGDFVVVWESYLQDGSLYGVFGQRFASTGARRGGEFQINTYTTGYQREPAVAVGSKGDFIVVWSSYQDGSYASVRGRRFDAAGNPLGDEFPVNSFTTGYQFKASVCRGSDGRFLVNWESENLDGSGDGIAARRFEADGTPIGNDFVVNTYTTGIQENTAVALRADGTFVVVWQDYSNARDGSASAILGQRLDAAGNRLGSEFLVNGATIGHQIQPSVSGSAGGGFVVAWKGEAGFGITREVLARRFDASGTALGNDLIVNTYTSEYHSGTRQMIASDARGNFVITWYGFRGGSSIIALGQRYTASGARRGGEFLIHSSTGNGRSPTIASDPVGNFVVTWTDVGDDGSSHGVSGQRFGGLAPEALAVDTADNGVLEPGETVDVRPAWRNFNGAAQTFSGTLTDIAGPPGATYAITDDSGDYGTVADGATAPCSDCYAVSVSNPPARPATHWDASAVESILPDTQGQQKEWLLHVGGSFADVPASSGFYRFIETLLHHGVTGGCSATEYCPAATTTRDQMAVFVLVAKEGAGYVPPACTTPMFADVPASSPFCRWIEELARRGVVGGCGGGNYCPASPVTREQMAVFVLRTLEPTFTPPACTTPVYGDVPAASPFCPWIEELTRRGVVSGCGGGNYCPAASVTREQMGVFLGVTFGLTLYGP